MSYSNLDRSYIRRFLGAGEIFKESWPLIEQAISATMSQADGGDQPDSTAENAIKGLIYGVAAVTGTQSGVTPGSASTTGVSFAIPALRGLLQLESSVAQQDTFLGTMELVGDVKLNAYREMIRLRNEGRRLCKILATRLGMKRPIADVFSPGYTGTIDDAGTEIFSFDRYW